MRYAACYRAGTVNVIAYVHLGDDGTVRLPRPIQRTVQITIHYPSQRRPFPEPEWASPHGPGPEGTYHG